MKCQLSYELDDMHCTNIGRLSLQTHYAFVDNVQPCGLPCTCTCTCTSLSVFCCGSNDFFFQGKNAHTYLMPIQLSLEKCFTHSSCFCFSFGSMHMWMGGMLGCVSHCLLPKSSWNCYCAMRLRSYLIFKQWLGQCVEPEKQDFDNTLIQGRNQ